MRSARTAGHVIAAVAIAAQVPRLVIVALHASRLQVPMEGALLAAFGALSALAYSGGSWYIGWTLSTSQRHRSLLMGLWLGVLVCLWGVLAPAVVSELEARHLAEVLSSRWLRLAWSIVSIGGLELVILGSMVAARAWQDEEPLDEASPAPGPGGIIRLGFSELVPQQQRPVPPAAGGAVTCPDCQKVLRVKVPGNERATITGHLQWCPARRGRKDAS